jgi:hypothetical protein
MTYTNVLNNKYHLFLPKRSRYTKSDWLYLLKEYRFNPSECLFIVKCTAIFHNAEYSKFFDKQENMLFS